MAPIVGVATVSQAPSADGLGKDRRDSGVLMACSFLAALAQAAASRHVVATTAVALWRVCVEDPGGAPPDQRDEIDARLAAIEPVLEASLSGKSVGSTDRAYRNIAVHNFNLPTPFAEIRRGQAKLLQRGRRKSASQPAGMTREEPASPLSQASPVEEEGGATLPRPPIPRHPFQPAADGGHTCDGPVRVSQHPPVKPAEAVQGKCDSGQVTSRPRRRTCGVNTLPGHLVVLSSTACTQTVPDTVAPAAVAATQKDLDEARRTWESRRQEGMRLALLAKSKRDPPKSPA